MVCLSATTSQKKCKIISATSSTFTGFFRLQDRQLKRCPLILFSSTSIALCSSIVIERSSLVKSPFFFLPFLQTLYDASYRACLESELDSVCLFVFICGCMIIGRTQKMLSCDWLQYFQYNQTDPQSREVSVHKESLQIA